MTNRPAGLVLRDAQTLFQHGTTSGLTDGQLLDRFIRRGDDAEAAFAILVARHSPMVLRVCRQTLSDSHDAQDAFQATFLCLIRSAARIRCRDSLASWLYGVAFRVSASARRSALRRRRLETRAAVTASTEARPGESDELDLVLREEVARLPTRYREAIVLCYLEGLTHDQVASRLGWPVGTVHSRLAWGRNRLRARLLRRGLAPAIALTGTEILPDTATGAVPEPLLTRTLQIASAFVRDQALGLIITKRVALMTERMLHSMLWNRVMVSALAALAFATVLAGVAAIAYEGGNEESQAPETKQTERAHSVEGPAPRLLDEERIRHILREIAEMAMSNDRPDYLGLTEIGEVQFKAGDREGARMSLRKAADIAADSTSPPMGKGWTLWRVAHFQIATGWSEDARATLRQAVSAVENVQDRQRQIDTLAVIIKAQAQAGDRAGARESLRRLLLLYAAAIGGDVAARFQLQEHDTDIESLKHALLNAKIGLASRAHIESFLMPKVVGAIAATGDFDRAFQTVLTRRDEPHFPAGYLLGEIAEAMEAWDRETARAVLKRTADLMESLGNSAQTYQGLNQLAAAHAKFGDFESARRTALSIGIGPSNVHYDLTDGQPYALLLVALAQKKTGDWKGARKTLRQGYETIRDHPKMRFASSRCQQIAEGLLGMGDIEGAFLTASLMNAKDKGSILIRIAEAQAFAGDKVAAQKTLGQARTDADHAEEIAGIEAMVGDYEQARKVARSIVAEESRNRAMNEIGRIQARSGDFDGVLEMVRKHEVGHRTLIAGIGFYIEQMNQK